MTCSKIYVTMCQTKELNSTMTQGQYIIDRWMVEMIQSTCEDRGISFRSYSDDWVIELQKGQTIRRVFGYKFDLNTSAASSIAADKVASYQVLHQHGIAAVEHRLVQTKAGQYSEWSDGLGKVVVKPLDGTSGHGVRLLESSSDVTRYIHAHPHIAAWAVSPYEEILSERRFIVLDNKIICSYEKQAVTIDGLKMFNLGLGAAAVTSPAPKELEVLALQASTALALRLAAVDVIVTDKGSKILEVNDGIMMENFMRQSDDHKALASQVYDAIIDAMFGVAL